MQSTESMSVSLIEGVVNVTLSDQNGGNKYLISRPLLAGVSHFLLIHLNYTTGYPTIVLTICSLNCLQVPVVYR